jgi:hypothetical protein
MAETTTRRIHQGHITHIVAYFPARPRWHSYPQNSFVHSVIPATLQCTMIIASLGHQSCKILKVLNFDKHSKTRQSTTSTAALDPFLSYGLLAQAMSSRFQRISLSPSTDIVTLLNDHCKTCSSWINVNEPESVHEVLT